jgi:hypothetical protein
VDAYAYGYMNGWMANSLLHIELRWGVGSVMLYYSRFIEEMKMKMGWNQTWKVYVHICQLALAARIHTSLVRRIPRYLIVIL